MPSYALHLLGSPRLEVDGAPVRVSRRKVMALLAYLAVTGRAHSRDALSALLWPEWDASAARADLRRDLSRVNQLLGGAGIEGDREAVALNPDLGLWLDVVAFRAQLGACAGHGHPITDACPDCVPLLEGAVALYIESFMAGFTLEDSAAFDEWQFFEAEALKDEVASALVRLAMYRTSQGDFERAIGHARRWLAVDPLHEPAHRHLMVLYARSNQRAAALRQYETCRRVLEAELGAEPSERTKGAYQQILKGEALLAPTAVEAVLERELREVGACPYRGLAAFREGDAPFFFGREAFADRLERTLNGGARVAMVVGSSGSGKSSVVRAGLLPRLREAAWLIADLRPGRDPFRALAASLSPLLEPELAPTDRMLQTRKLAAALEAGELPLSDIVAQVVGATARRRLLLLVDQAEELYTLCPDPEARRRFVDTLLATADAALGTRTFALLLTLRADFMGQVLAHRACAGTLQDAVHLLGPMEREELRAAIEKPAARQGAAFEAGLVARLLDDVGDEPGTLPLLEFALTLLWERLDFGWMTHAAYEAIGRVEGALARYADKVYDALSPEEQTLCRRIFTQLVQPGEGTEDTRRVATRAEIGDAVWSRVQHLADQRLVVTGRDELTGAETVEVVHEALIRNWGQLQAWMAEDRAFRVWQERLRAALRTWENTKRDEGALLRGVPLAEAEAWLAARSEELGAGEWAFIQAGIDLRSQQEEEREVQRRRELAAAEQLAEQRRLSAARLRRRAIYLSLALIVALAAAGLAGVFGWRSTNLAQDNARIAEQESLARATAQAEADARATAQAETEVQREEALRQAAIGLASEATLQMQGPAQDLAVLLALEAVGAYPYTWQAELALGQVVRDFRLEKEFHHGANLQDVPRLSPDGSRLLLAGADCELSVWDVQTGAALLRVATCRPVGGTAHFGKWSPSAERTLTTSHEGIPKVWDAETGDQLLELAGHGGLSAEWSPDGARVLSYASQGEDAAVIWDAITGDVITQLPGHLGIVELARFSPDGTLIATSLGQVWDARTGRLRTTLPEYRDQLTRDSQLPVSWSPDSSAIGAGMGDTARVWDAATGEERLVLATGYQGRTKLWWSPDARLILTVSLDGSEAPILWDAVTGRQLRQLAHSAQLTQLADPWSDKGDRIALRDDEGRVTVWEAATGREVLKLAVHEQVNEVAWLPGGERLVTSDAFAVARIWRVSTADLEVGCRPECQLDELSRTLNGFGRRPAWSPDGARVARQFAYGLVRIWDVTTGAEVLRIQQADRGFMNAIAWSPDGTRILTLTSPIFGTNGELEIWDATTGTSLGKLAEDCGGWEARWSPDGRRIVTYGFGAPATVWDVETGEIVTRNTGHDPWSADWSPDGTRLVSGETWTAGPVRIWDPETASTLRTLLPDDFPYGTAAVAWSPDGTQIVAFDGEGNGRIWAAESGELHGELVGPSNLFGAEWSPDGSRILVGSSSGVRVYDTTTMKEILTYPTSYLAWGSWSPDGASIAITTFDGDLKVYPAWQSLEELIAYAKAHCVLRELTPEERARYGLPARWP